jgi:hypothetical protein
MVNIILRSGNKITVEPIAVVYVLANMDLSEVCRNTLNFARCLLYAFGVARLCEIFTVGVHCKK